MTKPMRATATASRPAAAQLAATSPVLRAGQTLEQALSQLLRHDGGGLPVVTDGDRRVIGWLTHRDVPHVGAAARRRAPQPQSAQTEPRAASSNIRHPPSRSQQGSARSAEPTATPPAADRRSAATDGLGEEPGR